MSVRAFTKLVPHCSVRGIILLMAVVCCLPTALTVLWLWQAADSVDCVDLHIVAQPVIASCTVDSFDLKSAHSPHFPSPFLPTTPPSPIPPLPQMFICIYELVFLFCFVVFPCVCVCVVSVLGGLFWGFFVCWGFFLLLLLSLTLHFA